MQFQAIADRLAGISSPCAAADFDGYLKTVWQAIEKAPPGQAIQALRKAGLQKADFQELLEMLSVLDPGEKTARLPTMAELARTLRPIEWLWPHWIPRGMVTLLGASPGAGKSLLALDLANRILLGSEFPDGQPVPVQDASVVYVDAEDVPDLHYERALAWNMDLHRLYIKVARPGGMIDLSKPDQREQLLEEVLTLRPALVIIDALGNISNRGENAVEDVRELMIYLNYLAHASRAALLLIHHLRKGLALRGRSSELSMDDVRGSGQIIGMSRSVLGLLVVQNADQPDQNGPRLLRVLKSNVSRYPKALGFELVEKDEKAVSLEWGPPSADFGRTSLLAPCKAWLADLLRPGGEFKPAEVVALAKNAGFSRSTLYQARNALSDHILSTRAGSDSANTWKWKL